MNLIHSTARRTSSSAAAALVTPLQKNAMVGGALSGALVSAASSNHGDKIVKDAITAGAVATAVEFANYLT